MPLYNFATHTGSREEWAIEAKNIKQARLKLRADPDSLGSTDAILLDVGSIESREFVIQDDRTTPALEEITPDHWAWRAAYRKEFDASLRENICAIAADFHKHEHYEAFYDTFGRSLDGFTGIFALCIRMADALTEWELANGMGNAYDHAGVPWIKVVESFVNDIIETALEHGDIPDPAQALPLM